MFEEREINEEHKEYKNSREKLCEERIEECSKIKTPDWTKEDVLYVLNNLKTGKAKDAYDLPNEIFKPDIAGIDLVLAVTKLMNRIKNELSFPKMLELCNVTNIYKRKGDTSKFNSYRGIFRTPVLSNILDKLLHNDEYETIDENLTDGNVGSRKRRNVRDNLFVLNAIMNAAKQNKSEPVDIDVYDVHKCFDTMWLAESINDLYDNGIQNDKLSLIYLSNKCAKFAIKTSSGKTNQISIEQKVMQGRVWGGLMCTTTMDKLCKLVYDNSSLLYKYRGHVLVPPLEMVDDVVTASKCGTTAITLNETVNTFIELKKLKLSAGKCSQIHVGKKVNVCPAHKVHGEDMKKSDQEKYLGDFVTKKANSKDTLEDRINKGNGALSQMSAILSDIPLRKRRLRHAWFLNACLFNSEVWIGFNQQDLHPLEIIDKHILRLITGAQQKVPSEMLFLETGELPLKYVIIVRRLMYYQEIIKRHENELIKRVYTAMKKDPIKGDWINLVVDDFKFLDMTLEDEEEIENLSKNEFRSFVIKQIRYAAFKDLEEVKDSHEKVK